MWRRIRHGCEDIGLGRKEQAHSGTGAWKVMDIVYDTEYAGLPRLIGSKCNATDEHLKDMSQSTCVS